MKVLALALLMLMAAPALAAWPEKLGYGNILSLALVLTLLPKVPYDVEKDLTVIRRANVKVD